MTHRPIRVLEDGTHVYADSHRYKPTGETVRNRRKPDDPRAVRFRGDWFLPLDVLPDEARVMPETAPDAETLEHRAICRCHICQRPEATILWRRRHAELRFRPVSESDPSQSPSDRLERRLRGGGRSARST